MDELAGLKMLPKGEIRLGDTEGWGGPSPKDVREFESRLNNIFLHYHEKLIGLAHYVGTRKTLDREINEEMLVDLLVAIEGFDKNKPFTVHMDPITFLRIALEKDAPLGESDRYLLGVDRDRSGISQPDKNRIGVQAVAQAVWAIRKNKIPTIEKMKLVIRDDPDLVNLLRTKDYDIQKVSERTLSNWISAIFPVPGGKRRGRPSKGGIPDFLFDKIVPISGILNGENKICFPKLFNVLVTQVNTLKIMGLSIEQALASKVIRFYLDALPVYLQSAMRFWIGEKTRNSFLIYFKMREVHQAEHTVGSKS